MKRKQYISGLELHELGMSGHFRNSKHCINMDARWLDSRQYKRLKRARDRHERPQAISV